jgi:hypothetical protein
VTGQLRRQRDFLTGATTHAPVISTNSVNIITRLALKGHQNCGDSPQLQWGVVAV